MSSTRNGESSRSLDQELGELVELGLGGQPQLVQEVDDLLVRVRPARSWMS